MKRLSLIYIIIGVLAAASANADNDGVNVSNLTVSRQGANMNVKADMILDKLNLKSNRLLVLTPVLEDHAGNTAVFPSLMITGRSQHYVYLRSGNKNYPDAREVRRMNGTAQTVNYSESTAYEEWMRSKKATVRISVDTCGCGNLIGQNAGTPQKYNEKLDPSKLAKCPFVMPQATETPEQFISGAAYVTYELDSITLKPHLFNNPDELMKIYSDIHKVTQDSLLTITKVDIHGFASPEGTYIHNTYLARERAKTLLNWVKNECRRNNVKVGTFSSDFTPENWAGLVDSLNNHPELSHRDEILALAQSEMEPDQRDAAIKKQFPKEYRYILKNWYPYLRHADYRVGFRLGQVSVEQIKELIKTRPQVLSLNQMYQAAMTYEVGSDDFRQVFDVAVRMYPEDETANVNAACAALMKGDTEAADTYLSKAGNTAQAINARGVLEMLKENYTEAEQLFNEAKNAGLAEAGDNLQLLQQAK